MKTKLFFLLLIAIFASVAKARTGDLPVESLETFKARTRPRFPALPETCFASWSIGRNPTYYVSFPATYRMGRATPSADFPVGIGSPEGEIRIFVSVFQTHQLEERFKEPTCIELGNFLWKSECPGNNCSLKTGTKVNSDARYYMRYKMRHLTNGKIRDAYYQCSIGPDTTITVLADFEKPHGPFKKSSDLEILLNNFVVSRSKED